MNKGPIMIVEKAVKDLIRENEVLKYRLQRALASLSSHDPKLADYIEKVNP